MKAKLSLTGRPPAVHAAREVKPEGSGDKANAGDDIGNDVGAFLLEHHGFYRALVNALSEAVLLRAPNGQILVHNSSAERLLGLSAAQLRGQAPLPEAWQIVTEAGGASSAHTFIHDFRKSELPGAVALRTGRAQHNLLYHVIKEKGEVWLCANAQPLSEDASTSVPSVSVPSAVVVSFTDVTEQREDSARLKRQAAFRGSLIELAQASLEQGLDEAFYQRLMEAAVRVIPGAQAGSLLLQSGDAYRFVAAVNFDQSVLERTYLFEHELYRDPDIRGLQLIYGFDKSRRRDALYEAGDTGGIRVSMSIPVEMGGCAIAYFNLDNFDDKDAFTAEATEMGRIFAQQVAALWQRLKLEAELRSERAALLQLAFYDPLTQLPNRALLHDRLEHALAKSCRTKEPVALMFLDLDNFKEVNDNLGHDTGDLLLHAVSRRLEGCVRQGDTVARWGGDEFVLLLPGIAGKGAASRVAEKVLESFEAPFLLGGHHVQIGASVGIGLYPDPATTAAELTKHADTALYHAKSVGKLAYRVFQLESSA